MKPNKITEFNGAYLERYRRGELTHAEAHAVEKAALEDPLLADALEGFRLSDRDTTADLSDLKMRVQAQTKGNQALVRVLPKFKFFTPLMRVAAILLVVISAGWFSYMYWTGSRESAIAGNTLDTTEATKTGTQPESATLPRTNSAAPVQPEHILLPKPDPARLTDATKRPQAVLQQPKEDLALAAEQPMIEVETKREAVAAADVSIKDLDLEKTASDRNIAVETTVPAVSAKEKSLSRSKLAQQLTDLPVPDGGWEAYDAYLYRNRKVAPTATNTRTTFQVLLSFLVDPTGRPSDIRVEESAGAFYDEAAQKLLQDGPDWKTSKSGVRGQLRVHF